MLDAKLTFKVEKNMKKFVGILMVMLLSVTLVACGGVDKQPAIDAFNNATNLKEINLPNSLKTISRNSSVKPA